MHLVYLTRYQDAHVPGDLSAGKLPLSAKVTRMPAFGNFRLMAKFDQI